MRILHTSDWHLGRSFHGASLRGEQQAVVDRLVEITRTERVEVVVVAGDLYDRAIPPAEAVALFDEALVRLRDTGARVVAVAGNHDSPTRVAVADQLLEQAGVAIRGDVARCTSPVTAPSDDGGPPVAFYPIPYLEPALAAPILDRPSPDGPTEAGTRRATHGAVTSRATDLIRAHAAGSGCRSVVVAHTFVAGGTTTDSERDLTVGNVDCVALDAFAGFDLVLLGHLHRAQAWDDGRVAYSGSPLPFSFSEEHQQKSVRLVDVDPRGRCRAEAIPVGVGRPIRTLRGRLDDLLRRGDLTDAEGAWVRVRLTDPELPLGAMTRIQQRFPHALLLEHVPPDRRPAGTGDARSALAECPSPLDLATRFWADQHGTEPTPAQVAILECALTAAGREADR